MIICTPACLDPELAVAFTQPCSKICVALSIVRPNTQTYWSSWSAETKPWQLWHSQCPGCLGHTATENTKRNQCSPACLQHPSRRHLLLRGPAAGPAPHEHHTLSSTSTGKQLLPPNRMDGWCYGQAGREHASSGWVSPMKCSWHKASAFTNELFQGN